MERSISPARLTAGGFLLLILAGTVALMLPFSSQGSHFTPFMPAFFTATSAVSLTGLIVVDTATYWTPIGQAIIIGLIQLGGLGIMTLASLSGLVISGRISVKTRQFVAAEGRPITGASIRKMLAFTFLFTVAAELVIAIIIGTRLIVTYDYSFSRAAWEGVFHSISAFNNAGFSTHSDNLISFTHDAWILLPLAAALIGGGLGYPVWAELLTGHTSITTRMTVKATIFLLVVGAVFVAFAEWDGFLAGMTVSEKILNAFFQGTVPRTAGFNSVDYAEAHPITLMGTNVLMFIGGGSAGTAGGIKVTTACVLVVAMAAEFLGREDTTIGRRRIPHTVMRQALALTFAGVVVVAFGIGAVRVFDPEFTGDQVNFEVFSAFATVGLSTGITATLSTPSQIVLCFLMYLGRIGPTTLVASLAARSVLKRYRYPEERPIIG